MRMSDIGKRIIVIGSPGSGKSTFSRKLSEVTGIPLIHLDKEFWNYGWVETPREEWVKKQGAFICEDEWIIDGNYGGTLDIRVERADTIISFQLSRVVCLIRYFKRVIKNINKLRPDMPEGCPEQFDFEFMKYIWNFPKESGKRNLERIHNSKDKNIIIFKNKNDANSFICRLNDNSKLL
jgi:adenylate kinase family enzyme